MAKPFLHLVLFVVLVVLWTGSAQKVPTTGRESTAEQLLPELFARIDLLEKRIQACSCPEGKDYQKESHSKFPRAVLNEILLEAARSRLGTFEEADVNNAGPKEIVMQCTEDPTVTVKDLPDDARDSNECM